MNYNVAKLVLLALFLPLAPSYGEVPRSIGYQGRLVDQTGVPVNGSVSFTFSLYGAATGGPALWTESQVIQVTNGIFNVDLGASTPLMPGLFTSGDLFLGIKVAADSEMVPRQRVTSGAYSLRAESSLKVDLAPPDMEYPPFGGDGSDGPLVVSDGTVSLTRGRVYQFSSVSISGTGVIAATGGASTSVPLIIRCSGDVDISGAINLKGVGVTGGGGGGNDAAGGPGTSVLIFLEGGLGGGGTTGNHGGGGGAGAGSSGQSAGGIGGQHLLSVARLSSLALVGAGGGGGKCNYTVPAWAVAGAGGSGGGAISLEVAGNLTISGLVDVRGNDGTSGGGSGCAGGGGGGGGSFVATVRGAINLEGASFLAHGGNGNGSPTGGFGGKGGDGRIFVGNGTP